MKAELSWKNAQNQTLFAAQWHVEFPKAAICLVHGAGEHVGRYEAICQFFNENGLAVIGFDQQGHGRSDGKRGHAPSIDSLLDDIGLCLDEVRSRYPGTPIFMYGHSLGGLETLTFLLKRRPAGLAGAVVTSPWIQLAFPAPAVKVWVGRLLKKIAPSLTLSNDLDVNGISRDPEIVARYINDPLVHGRISAAAGIDGMEAANWLNNFEGEMPVPTLLAHGSADRLTSFSASEAFAGRVKNVFWKPWPGLFHETHNEPEKREVWQFYLDWMLARLAR